MGEEKIQEWMDKGRGRRRFSARKRGCNNISHGKYLRYANDVVIISTEEL